MFDKFHFNLGVGQLLAENGDGYLLSSPKVLMYANKRKKLFFHLFAQADQGLCTNCV